ncbi:MAG: hypothetical protein NTY03_04230, partial [Candidatus Bathyarchaeota archaeon]|nr:hypothetical protein [Candidatus Bathyarchaeota archaeon]
MQQHKEAIVTLRGVAKEIPPLQAVTDIIRNEFMPHASTSRIIKSESGEGYHIYINIHQLPEYHPKISE